ncbi:BnaCnng47240D [Brassica napus]|uniref:BnaCnng47240D protein n=3 Tax=Brassica TaxID=3705 RepID=A0A078JCX1_BRANA|nr:BnaCnng47240D [Brassica napus]VDD35404.1 unnamed protein product [Brassica oleracea]
MVKASIFLSDLKIGRCSSTVQVRLLRLWEAKNVRRSCKLMGVDMLQLDSHATMMPATLNVNRLGTHRPNLNAGSTYSLTSFDVTRCNQNYRLSDSSMLITFSSQAPQQMLGRLFLNATSETHVCFDKETTAGERYFYRLVSQDTGLPSAAPLLKSNAKVTTLSIAELSEFVIAAPSQVLDHIYIYRVEMSVADETAEGLFVCFDGVMTKLHNMRANEAGHLLANEGVKPEETQAPPFVAAMEGKTYIFQGGDDDNGDDNPDVISVPAKVEFGGSSQAQVFAGKVKKARKA